MAAESEVMTGRGHDEPTTSDSDKTATDTDDKSSSDEMPRGMADKDSNRD